jgi:outer membrane lipoprotein-sorting protein
MKRFVLLMSVIALLLASSSVTAAEEDKPSAVEILSRMEKYLNGFADQTMDIGLTVVDVNGAKKLYEFTVQQKGDTQRLILFTSGEMKDMATLIEDRNRMYVYLPGFKKVRRIAAHNMNQSFAGSDLSNDDMASVSWTKLYDVKLDREDEQGYHLTATPKPGETSEYSKVQLKVQKGSFAQAGAAYFNKAGEKMKVWECTNLVDFNGVKRNKLITITDPRTGHKTIMEVKAFKVNQGLKDDLFSVRQLQWSK